MHTFTSQAHEGSAGNDDAHPEFCGNVSRQQRRAFHRSLNKEVEGLAKQVARDIGFEPEFQEVEDLIAASIQQKLISPVDQPALHDVIAGLQSGAVQPSTAYAALVSLIKRGPFAELVPGLLERLYGLESVIEFRAVRPNGGAKSFCGRLGHERVAMVEFLMQHIGSANIYFGINPRKPELARSYRAASAGDVVRREYVVLDLDNKDAPPDDPAWKSVREALAAHDPIMTVSSGNGYHEWFAIQPVESAELEASVVPLARAMTAIGSDNMADLPRVIRLPFTINIPTKSKRVRGNRLALAGVNSGPHTVGLELHDYKDLTQRMEGIAQIIDRSGNKGLEKSDAGPVGSVNRQPSNRLTAPNFNLLFLILDNLPNDDWRDRNYWVRIGLAVRGACAGTDFEQQGREKFFEWADRHSSANDDNNEKLWRSADRTGSGWPHLLEILKDNNPAAWTMIQNMLAPIRHEQACAAFKDNPIDPAQIHLLQPTGTLQNQGCDRGTEQFASPSGANEANKSGDKGGKPVERAIQSLVANHAEIFPDQNGSSFVKLDGRNHNVCIKSGQRAVLGWLAQRNFSLTGNSRAALVEAIEDRAYALPARHVSYRQADGTDTNNPEAYINLMDGMGVGVRVDRNNWRIAPVAGFGVEMTDRDKSEPLPAPVHSIVDFFDLFGRHIPLHPIKKPNDPTDQGVQQRAILLCFLLAQFYRPGAVPHLFLTGGQGSGKTVFARWIKGLTDPDRADVVSGLPSEDSSIYAFAGQQTLLVLDNLSDIKPQHSDVLCLLSTGGAYQRRQLYTDTDRVVSKAKCSVVFTSIREDMIWREDLLDRTLIYRMVPLDPAMRRPEADLNAEWERDRPAILGALLDLLSGALARFARVKVASEVGLLPPLPRIADAALVAEAAAWSMGWPMGLCIKALNEARRVDSDDQLTNNPVAYRVRELIRQNAGRWSGSNTDLFAAIGMIEGPDWGRNSPSANLIGNALVRVAEPMRQVYGITITRWRTRTQRGWEITGPAGEDKKGAA